MERTFLASALLALVACATPESAPGLDPEACLSTPSPVPAPAFAPGFPEIDGVTWTSDQTAGPSHIVIGYTGRPLEEVFSEAKMLFAQGAYSIEKSERDLRDAEVNFASDTNRGQVRLGEECQGRTSVSITIRPAS